MISNKLFRIKLFFSIFLILAFCACKPSEMSSKYKVTRIDAKPEINAVWDKAPWTGIKSLEIKNHMGEKPEHFPFSQAKIAYDNNSIYVIFQVEDKYVKAVHANNQDPVYKDSCVEFFFSPDSNSDNGYFNLEMNCGGTMLFHHQKVPRSGAVPISEEDIKQMEVAHSMPGIVDPEIKEDTIWTVEYKIPFSILTKYHAFPKPEAGSVWRANLYKCADATSHPHWITWAKIDVPRPDFHRPEYFGTLEFQ